MRVMRGRRLLTLLVVLAALAAAALIARPYLHGLSFVVRAAEMQDTARRIADFDAAADLRGHAPVRLLLSGLISHAEADKPMHAGDVLQLAGFWGDLLSR